MSFDNKVARKPVTIKDTFYTLSPVNAVLRFFVLTSVKRKQNELVQCWSLAENIVVFGIMLAINIFFLINKIQGFDAYKKNDSLKFTDTLQLTYLLGFTEYIIDLVYVYKTRHTCLKYVKFYANIDKILGAPNFSCMRAKSLTAVTSLVLGSVLVSSLDFVSWVMGIGWLLPALYSIDYLYVFVNSLTVVDVIANVVQIQYRLSLMLRLIEDFHSTSSSLSGAEIVDDSWVFEAEKKTRVDRLLTVSCNKCFGILSLSKYYVLLNEQIIYINSAYGLRLAAFGLNLLINLIYLTNIIIRASLGILTGAVTITHDIFHVPSVTTTLRIVNYCSVLLILVYHCQKTYTLCDSIIRMIDLTVINKKIPQDLKDALTDLRGLVLSRPIKFHGGHFFTLDHSLLVSIASVVVTYTIILLQSMR